MSEDQLFIRVEVKTVMSISLAKEWQSEAPFIFHSFKNEYIYIYIYICYVSNSNWFSACSSLIPVIYSENFQIVQHQIRE
jgi:hypothetical protein